jgi:hypothetical protein
MVVELHGRGTSGCVLAIRSVLKNDLSKINYFLYGDELGIVDGI